MKSNILFIVLLAIAALVLVQWLNAPRPQLQPRLERTLEIRTRTDTVTVYRMHKPAPISVRYRATIDSERRTACLDTLIDLDTDATNHDTLSICYDLRADSFSLALRYALRRTRFEIPLARSDTVSREIEFVALPTESNVLRDMLTLIGVAAAGWFVGRLIR